MSARGIILYGPPASGKDTITAALEQLDGVFTRLPTLKVGAGRSHGYRWISLARLHRLRRMGRLITETHRYGNIYAVDGDDVLNLQDAGKIPVVHIGNVPALRSLTEALPGPWLRVLLWIRREECASRSRERGDLDTLRRLGAWDETASDLSDNDDGHVFDLRLDTALATPESAARMIGKAAREIV